MSQILEQIENPGQLKRLSIPQLERLAMELRALMDRKIRMETRGKLPIQPMAMLSTRTLHHAVRALHPTRMTQLYIIEPGTMRLLGILTEQQLIAAYLSAPQRTLAEEVDA